jgi:hypothetical protein
MAFAGTTELETTLTTRTTLGSPSGLPGPPGLPSPPLEPAALISEKIFCQWLEDEIMTHFELVKAVVDSTSNNDTGPAIPITFPRDWAGLENILKKLAYNMSTIDHWACLGLAMYEGPEPNEGIINSRIRTANLLCDLALKSNWAAQDKTAAEAAKARFDEATGHCENELAGVLAERRKIRPSKLPLWKELGLEGRKLIEDTAEFLDEEILLSWSDVLNESKPLSVLEDSRKIADLAEKGDEKLWDALANRSVVLWAPTDKNALARCLSTLLRRSGPGSRPKSLRLVVNMPLAHGANSVQQVLDSWWHPMLSEKWATIVKSYAFCNAPLEMVLPGRNAPAHSRMGMVVFTLSHEAHHAPPRMFDLKAPILKLNEVVAVTVDIPTNKTAALMTWLAHKDLKKVTCRHPVRSPLTTKEVPRVNLQLIFPQDSTELEQLLIMKELRRVTFTQDTFFGLNTMHRSSNAMVLEVNSPLGLRHFWPLCSQLIPVSKNKVLIYTETAADTWIDSMNALLKQDPDTAATKLKWKPSKFGGRPFAVPSATSTTLGATSRQAGKTSSSRMDHITDITVRGELGREDGAILKSLMQHLALKTGLNIKVGNELGGPKVNEYVHLASIDPSAPPGRLRLYLGSQDDVRRVANALHGQVVEVGSDLVAIEVTNDLNNSMQGYVNRGR